MRFFRQPIARAFVGIWGLAGLVAGCGPRHGVTSPLHIAVLPILDSLPLYVAQEEGFFADEDLNVALLPAGAAAERDQLLQAKEADGAISDLVAVALANRQERRLVVVRYAMSATPEFAQFRILAAATSRIDTVGDLRGKPIGVSEGTVIEYVTDRLLRAEGVASDDITVLGVPRIPDRMALLASGQLEAATLPEPLASLAVQQGARSIAEDSAHPDLSCSVYAFRSEVLDTRGDEVRRFIRAVNRAAAAINADKSRWGDLLLEQALIPSSLQNAYALPDYPEPALPSEAQYADVTLWLVEAGLLDSAASYAVSVDSAFLE